MNWTHVYMTFDLTSALVLNPKVFISTPGTPCIYIYTHKHTHTHTFMNDINYTCWLHKRPNLYIQYSCKQLEACNLPTSNTHMELTLKTALMCLTIDCSSRLQQWMFILEYLFIMHTLQHILNDILVFFVYLWNVNIKFLLPWYYCFSPSLF